MQGQHYSYRVHCGQIDHLAQTNRWNNTTTYANVANTLKGFAHDWLFATAEMDCRTSHMDQPETKISEAVHDTERGNDDHQRTFQLGDEALQINRIITGKNH
jgi:hypothetical protein